MRNFFWAVIAAALLAGCASGTPITSEMMTDPPAGMARLVIYRPSELLLHFEHPRLRVNEVAACGAPSGRSYIKDVAPGKVAVSADLWDFPGTSRLSWDAEGGRTYYVRVSVSDGKAASAVLGGYVALFAAEAVSERGGPFYIDLTDQAAVLESGVTLVKCTR